MGLASSTSMWNGEPPKQFPRRLVTPALKTHDPMETTLHIRFVESHKVRGGKNDACLLLACLLLIQVV